MYWMGLTKKREEDNVNIHFFLKFFLWDPSKIKKGIKEYVYNTKKKKIIIIKKKKKKKCGIIIIIKKKIVIIVIIIIKK